MSTQSNRRVLATLVAGTALLLSGTAVAQTTAGVNNQADGQRTKAGTNVANQAQVQFQKLSATGFAEGAQIVVSDDPAIGGETDTTNFTVDHLIDLQITKPNTDVTFDRDAVAAVGLVQVLTLTNKGNDDDEYHIDIDLEGDSNLSAAGTGFVGHISVYEDTNNNGILDNTDVLLSSMDTTGGALTIHNKVEILLPDGDVTADTTPAFILGGTAPAAFARSQTPSQVVETGKQLLVVTTKADAAATASAPDPAATTPPDSGTSAVLPSGVENGQYARYKITARSFDSVMDDTADRDSNDTNFADDVLVGDADGNTLSGAEEKVIVDAQDDESSSAFVDGEGVAKTDLTGLRDGLDAEIVTFIAQAVDATFAKTATVLCDPINGTTSPYAIPGAYVEYRLIITVEAGSDPALYTILTDNLPNDVVFDPKGITGATCEESTINSATTDERDGNPTADRPVTVNVCAFTDRPGAASCTVSHHEVAGALPGTLTLTQLQANPAALTGALPTIDPNDLQGTATVLADTIASGLTPPTGTPFAVHLPSTSGTPEAGGTLIFTLPAFANTSTNPNPVGGVFQEDVYFEILFNAYIR